MSAYKNVNFIAQLQFAKETSSTSLNDASIETTANHDPLLGIFRHQCAVHCNKMKQKI